MGTMYKFSNAKLTKGDNNTVVYQGVMYGYGSSGESDWYSKNEIGISELYDEAHMAGKCIGLNSKVASFGFVFDTSIPSDYPQFSPFVKAGIFNLIYKNDNTYGVTDTIYKFYPVASDSSFFIKILLRKTPGQNGGSVNMWLCRPSIGLEWWLCDIGIPTGFYTGTAFGAIGQVGIVYLPWYPKENGHNTRGACYASVQIKYDFVGPESGGIDDLHIIVSEIGNRYLGREDYDAIWNQFTNGYNPEEVDVDNPYSGGGTSSEGGGEGNFSEESDAPETDLLPSLSALATGFATIFKPDASQLRALSELFWNSNVFTFLQNLVENITNMFTSLAIVPFDVLAGNTVSVRWLGIDTAISLTLAARQYYEFDMGSIDMANDSRIFTSGSVLDYSPFSKLGIYLPFIGYQELDIDECRDAVINLRYRIDILSGACVAILKVGGRDLYQFTGNCLTQIPITNESMQSLVSDAVNVGIAAAGVGATGASVGADLAEAASSKSGIEYADIANAHRSINRAESGLASATVNAVIGSKPTFNKSGAVSSSASMMSLKQPYLFLTTPRQSIPDHYQRYRGFPSNITSKLGDLSGFTVVEDIRLNGLVATSPEVAEIYDLLKKGVII